jgi:hypothetical protein
VGRDCDGFDYTCRTVIPATVVHYNRFLQQAHEDSDGYEWHRIESFQDTVEANIEQPGNLNTLRVLQRIKEERIAAWKRGELKFNDGTEV